MYKKQTNRIMRGLSALVLSIATFWVATSADAQIVIDGHFADWDGINAATVDDAKDMADSSGDIRQIQAHVEGGNLHLSMTVHGIAAPSVDDTPEGMKNRYYYHWLLDTDNDTATGFKTDAYEGNSTGLAKPLGVDLIIQFGWRDGKPNGLSAYDVLIGDDAPLVEDYEFSVSGDTINAVIALSDLKLTEGQSVGFSAFQEGASDGWAVDFVESASLVLSGPVSPAASVNDPKDMADSSGDVKNIKAVVKGDNLHLSMTVHGIAAPSVDDTPEGMKNRYYYHWLFDTDNDTATGFKTDAYEGNSTGLAKPLGVDLIVQFGWRDGKPNGLSAYDVLIGDDAPLVEDYEFSVSGDTISAVIPLADLKLTAGQSVGFSAFQEGASDGWSVDFVESNSLTLESAGLAGLAEVSDPKDMADSSGDIRNIQAVVQGSNLFLRMTVDGIAAPSTDDTPDGMKNRYYYHWLLDTDNDTATGFKTDAYEGNSTGLAKPLGVDLIIQFGWRDGKPNGLSAYDVLIGDDAPLVVDYTFATGGDSIEAMIPLADLGLTPGQTVGFSAFQEGASDGWAVDFVESSPLTLKEVGGGRMAIDGNFDDWTAPVAAPASVTSVDDPKDMADSSGDVKNITAHVEGDNLHLTMSVYGIAAPSVDETPEGMKNRYYYHWLLDTDNDTATGFKTDAYEGNSTGLAKPLGVDLIIQFGWRDGKPNGLSAYDVLIGDDAPLVEDYEFSVSGDTISAVIALADLKLTVGQSVGFSAFQEGASDGWAVDFVESDSLTLEGAKAEDGIASVDDPKDMADSSGDIKQIHALVENGNLYLKMSVYGIMAPSVEQTPEGMKNRYYYHWLLDTDNDTATGFKTDAYEGNSTGLAKPLGVDLIIQFGWRDGKPNGLSAYDVLIGDDAPLVENYTFAVGSDSVEVVIPLADLGLTLGQSVGFSAFQEGASDGWAVDFVESTTLTLSQDSAVDMTLETLFTGNAYGFEIQVMDDGDTKVDGASVAVAVNGTSVEATVTQANGVTVITGQNPSLIPEGASLTVSLTLDAGGATQSKDFVIGIDAYTVLPEALNLGSAKKESGFLVGVTQISSATTLLPSMHENKAELAEKQLAGEMLDPDYEDEEVPYVNEAHEDAEEEFVVVYDTPDVINWFEQAPGEAGNFRAGLGFEDKPFPFLPGWNEMHDGVVIEIRAYLELGAGSYKIGMNGEGGWKVSAGTDANGVSVGTFDNSTMLPGEDNVLGTDDDVPLLLVPTYYPLDQYVTIVVTKAGLYPIRVLWFQSRHNKAPGMQLELFTVKDRAKHLINDLNDPKAIKAYRAGDLLPFGVPEGIESAGLTRVVNDKIIFETDTANQNNWEPFSSVIGNSTFVVEANTFADPEEDYNQRYMLAFQPVGGGEAKMGEVFHGDDGSPYIGKINGSRQNGNPGRVAADTRPGAVNFIAGGEASPHMFDAFQSDGRWDLGVDRLEDGRYGAVQTYSLDTETLAQTPLSNAIDAINGRLTEGTAPGNQVGRFGGDMVGLSDGNFAVVVEDRSGFHTDGTAATAVIIAPDGSIVKESFVVASGSIWSNVAAFKGGWAARVGGVIYFFDNAGESLGESNQADSGVSFDGGRGDGTRIYGHINSPYVYLAGVVDGQVQLGVWDSRDQKFVASALVSEDSYEASFERVNLASDALNRVVVAYESKPTAEGKEYEQHQVTVRVLAFNAESKSISYLTPSLFAFTNQAASGIQTVRPTVAMTTKEILIAAKGEINKANNPADGSDTEPQTTFYTVFSHPDPQDDPTAKSTPSEPPTLSIVNNGNGTVTVTFEGKLQAAASVNGPWADVAGATSPLTLSANEAQQYARAVGE
jgi:hypothetical protein